MFWLFAMIRSCIGIGDAAFASVTTAIISDLFVGKQRTKVLSIFYLAVPVGSGMGYIIGSNLAMAFGDWRWSLRFTPMLCVLCVLLLCICYREPKRGMADGLADANPKQSTFTTDIVYLLRKYLTNIFQQKQKKNKADQACFVCFKQDVYVGHFCQYLSMLYDWRTVLVVSDFCQIRILIAETRIKPVNIFSFFNKFFLISKQSSTYMGREFSKLWVFTETLFTTKGCVDIRSAVNCWWHTWHRDFTHTCNKVNSIPSYMASKHP
jgi:MFS family permease